MTRLFVVAGVAVILAVGTWLVIDSGASAASATPGRTVAVRVGDNIRVVDAPIGCRVVRLTELDGRITIDCRRAGSLAGTYGTLLTSRNAALVRFVSRSTGRMLFVARHEGGVRKCAARR
jgi:hypothetical protein